MLRIPIDYKLIDDSPYSGDNNCAFVFNDTRVSKHLSKEITNGNLTSILISGYRGVGKTSFIGRLKFDIEKEASNILFVKLNVAKYEKYANVLRQIIRQIYLVLIKTGKLHELENRAEIELLHDRTFADIQASNMQTVQVEKKAIALSEINLKSLIPPLFTALGTGLLAFFPYITQRFPKAFSYVSELLNWIVGFISSLTGDFINFSKSLPYIEGLSFLSFICSLVWASMEVAKLKFEISRKVSDSEELNRKTLYDDEIAECRLLNVLETLKGQKLKLIFVIDELDKIGEDDKITKLVSELKPLILSGYATFILVSGQSLYYKYHTSQTLDDNIVASVFSKIVHIPLFSTDDFLKLFENLIPVDKKIPIDRYKRYVYSKVLQANRLPRRFINLIRQDLVWDDSQAYIEITDINDEAYNTDYKILEVIIDIEKNELEKYKEGIKDFLISQLHLWVQRMKLRKGTEFRLEDLYSEEEYEDEFVKWYLFDVQRLLSSLLDTMVYQSLLETVDAVDEDEEQVAYYKWSESAVIQMGTSEASEWPAQSRFLQEFNDLEEMLRIVATDFSEYLTPVGMDSVIKVLQAKDIIPDEYRELKEINAIRNKLVYGKEINLEDLMNIEEIMQRIAPIKGRITEKHVYLVVQDFFERTNPSYVVNYVNTQRFPVDIEVISHQALPKFYFEVKAASSLNYSMLKQTFLQIRQVVVEQSSDKICYGILVTYLKDKAETRLKSYLDKQLIMEDEVDRRILWCNIKFSGDLNRFLGKKLLSIITEQNERLNSNYDTTLG